MAGRLYESVEGHIIENRQYPRLPITGEGTLEGISVTLRNISRSGIQLACAAENFASVDALLDRETLALKLSVQPPISLTAEFVYSAEIDAVHLIGMHFVQVTRTQQRALDGLLQSLR